MADRRRDRRNISFRFCASLTLLVTAACSADHGSESHSEPSSKSPYAALRYDAGPPPRDVSNRFSEEPRAALFGQRLFFDPSFSGPLLEGDNDGTRGTLGRQGETGKVACASCHVPSSGFVDTRSPHRQISLASEWTTRRSPSLLEVAFEPLYNWDGRRDSIWGQAMGVIESSREFNSSRLYVAQRLFDAYRADYEALFGAMPALDDRTRFPKLAPENAGCVEKLTKQGSVHICRGVPGDKAEFDGMTVADRDAVTTVAVNAAKALAAYVRLLRCGPSRFDAFIDGDASALNAAEQRGAALFVGKGRCSRCHSGPNLADGRFHNVGLSPATVAVAFTDTNDRGAAEGIAALHGDPLATSGKFSDSDRGVIPDTLGEEFVGAFRTTSLRCSGSHSSFFHTGQLATLAEVVAFKNRGGDAFGYPGQNELKPLGLSADEEADLVAFLEALEGEGPAATLREAL